MTKLTKKLSSVTASIFALSLFAACAAPTPVMQASLSSFETVQKVAVTQQSMSTTVIDVGQGIKTPATFSVTINAESGGFTTQASSSGTTNSVIADVDEFHVYLIDKGTAPTGTETAAFGPFTVATTGATQTITFSNVTESTNDFYVAIAAIDGVANVTNLASSITADGERVYVSTSGGNGTGGVAVGAAPTYTITDTTQLAVPLTLLDALGATIDSEVTVTDGSTAPASAVGAS